MRIKRFVSPPAKSPFAPNYEWFLAVDKLDDIDFSKIAELVLLKEKQIISTTLPRENNYTVDSFTGLGDNSLTSRSDNFNVLLWDSEEVNRLKHNIHRLYVEFLTALNIERKKVWIQCWANVLRGGENLNAHMHSVSQYAYLSGHITVQCTNTSTIYINPVNQINAPEEFEMKNEVGIITLFPQTIPHYTTPHDGNGERITIAFDIILDEEYQLNSPKGVWIPFDMQEK